MTRLLILPAIFVVASLSLWVMISSAPDWRTSIAPAAQSADAGISPAPAGLELPTQFDNFTVVVEQFRTYKEDHYIYITTLFICIYLYKQTFAIPGSFLLNIIAGAVFGMWTGFVMVCVLTTCGSSLCYLFSELFSREYVLYYFGERLTYLQQKVDDNSHRLLPFLLFARMFPISPSWLLNIVAPFLNIPLPIFAFSALIGLAPYNFICVQAGYILADLKSWDDVLSTSTMLKLCSFALLPLAYALFVRRQPVVQEMTGSAGGATTWRSWMRRRGGTYCCGCCAATQRRKRRVISIAAKESPNAKQGEIVFYDDEDIMKADSHCFENEAIYEDDDERITSAIARRDQLSDARNKDVDMNCKRLQERKEPPVEFLV